MSRTGRMVGLAGVLAAIEAGPARADDLDCDDRLLRGRPAVCLAAAVPDTVRLTPDGNRYLDEADVQVEVLARGDRPEDADGSDFSLTVTLEAVPATGPLVEADTVSIPLVRRSRDGLHRLHATLRFDPVEHASTAP